MAAAPITPGTTESSTWDSANRDEEQARALAAGLKREADWALDPARAARRQVLAAGRVWVVAEASAVALALAATPTQLWAAVLVRRVALARAMARALALARARVAQAVLGLALAPVQAVARAPALAQV